MEVMLAAGQVRKQSIEVMLAAAALPGGPAPCDCVKSEAPPEPGFVYGQGLAGVSGGVRKAGMLDCWLEPWR